MNRGWCQRMLILLVARRRTVGLGALALMAGMLFWGRLLMQDVPRTAIAEPELAQIQPANPDAPPQGRPLPSGGSGESALQRDLFRVADAGRVDQLNGVKEKNQATEQKSAN